MEQQKRYKEIKQKRRDLEEKCAKLKVESDFLQRNINSALAENADLLFERRRLDVEISELNRTIDLSEAQIHNLNLTRRKARRRYLEHRRKTGEGKEGDTVGASGGKRSLFSEQKSLKYGASFQSRLMTTDHKKALKEREMLLQKENAALKEAR